MARTARTSCESEIYHLIARGVGRQIVFEDDIDRRKFLTLVDREFNDEKADEERVELLAWCLMDNHIHLLAKGNLGSISKCMQKVESAYAIHFNRRHQRAGHLFQDRFKSEPIEDDRQLAIALRYIHRNPVKAGIASVGGYRWSSYQEYLGAPRIVHTEWALNVLGGRDSFISMHANDEDLPLWDFDVPVRMAPIEDLKVYARRILDGADPSDLKSLPKGERNALLARLKDGGLSTKQIERLTSIGRNIITRA